MNETNLNEDEINQMLLECWEETKTEYTLTLCTEDIIWRLAKILELEDATEEVVKHVAEHFDFDAWVKSVDTGFSYHQWEIVDDANAFATENIPNLRIEVKVTSDFYKLQEIMCDCDDDCPNSEQQKIAKDLIQDICLLCEGRIGEPFNPKYIEDDLSD